jgi:hypothetical protein
MRRKESGKEWMLTELSFGAPGELACAGFYRAAKGGDRPAMIRPIILVLVLAKPRPALVRIARCITCSGW